MGIESVSRVTTSQSEPRDNLPMLGSLGWTGMNDFPNLGGGFSHHNTAHGPMRRPPGFEPPKPFVRNSQVVLCGSLQSEISAQQSALSRARWLRNIGVFLSVQSFSIPLGVAMARRHPESIFNRSNAVFGAALMGFALIEGAGLYLFKSGASRISSTQDALRNAQSQFDEGNCSQVLATATKNTATAQVQQFEARPMAKYAAPTSWGKIAALGAAAAVTTVLAAAAIAEDFFPVAGGPANDVPAVTAAAASWRLYLACF